MSIQKQGLWAGLVNSFDPRSYQNIVTQSFGRSTAYLALLAFVVSIILSINYTIALTKFGNTSRQWMQMHIDELWPKGLSEVKINNGQVYSATRQPFIHSWKNFTFVLDTTQAASSLDKYKQAVLLTKDKVILKSTKSMQQAEIKEYSLSGVKSFSASKGDATQGIIAKLVGNGKHLDISLESIKRWSIIFYWVAFVFMIVFFVAYYLIAKIIQVLIFSIFALIANGVMKAKLKYGNLLNIAAYALTPATAVSVLIMVAGRSFGMLTLTYCLVFCVYLILGIKHSKESVPA